MGELFNNKNIEECLEEFCGKYNELINQHIPRKTCSSDRISSTGNIKWFNEEINQATKEKFRIHSQLRAASISNRAVLKIKFNKTCREVKRLIKRVHMSYELDIASKSKANPKLLYAYVNSQNSRKEKIRMLITVDGDHLLEGSDIVECLNNQ